MRKDDLQKRLEAYLEQKKGFMYNPTCSKLYQVASMGLGTSILAILPVTQVQGTVIVYEVPGSKQVLTAETSYGINIDDPGQVNGAEFSLYLYYSAMYFIKSVPDLYHVGEGDKLAAGVIINAGNATKNVGLYEKVHLTNRTGIQGPWLNDNSIGYWGFKFKIGMNFHYGWIELQVTDAAPGLGQVIITRWAYEDDSSITGIAAGSIVSLPVELTSFTAKAGQESIQLGWLTASEENNAGFEVQRSTDGKNFRTLTFIEGHGTTLEAQKYFYDDKELRKNRLYYYRLKQIDYDGRFEYSDVVTAQLEEDSKFSVIAPNPTTTGQTKLEYTSDTEGELSVQVFDVTGRELVKQVHGVSEGTNAIDLDLSALGKGMYFVKLEQGSWSGYEKVVVE